jgi:hypothetical protein
VKICFVGAGYVGLVSAAGFAELGNHVTCVDVDERRIERLRHGEVPIFEPDLEELVRRNLSAPLRGREDPRAQKHGTRGHERTGTANRGLEPTPDSRRLEPGISQRRGSRARLLAPGSHRHRLRRRRPHGLKKIMRRPLLLDGRNIWSSYQLRELGFTYEGIGMKGQ